MTYFVFWIGMFGGAIGSHRALLNGWPTWRAILAGVVFGWLCIGLVLAFLTLLGAVL